MKKTFCVLTVVLLLFVSFKAQAVNVSAACAVLIDADSGDVLFASNANERRSMASTTKIMTALLLCENTDLEDTLVITKEMVMVEGTSMGLRAGMTVKYKDLLYGMLLSSGNDAANAAAIGVSGSIESFVALMNKRAQELNLCNTHFNTPSGLDGESHYTTALELALLTRKALANADFAKACATKSITLEYGGAKHTLTNHNRLLSMVEGTVGVKTGFTKKSGRCLVSAAKRNGLFLIAVTLNDPNDWKDHKEMLEYGFNTVKSKTVDFEAESYLIPAVSSNTKNITVNAPAVSFLCSENADITKTVYLPSFVYAPVKKGEVIGYIEYKNGENIAGVQQLLAVQDVSLEKPPTFYKRFLRNLKTILGEVL